MFSLRSSLSGIFCLLWIMSTLVQATVIRMTHNFNDPMIPKEYKIEFNKNESIAVGNYMVQSLHDEFTYAILNLENVSADENFHGSILEVRNLTAESCQALVESVEKQSYVKAVYPEITPEKD
ncbi:hypothetical protein J3Q64DRAFT_1718277 [Phycomyces blakesleeanus]|uniref:Uncharacterized protein n=2 Tax=Phycomyces blakesleeanus TaxID=4837 RepID=A0A163B8C4_PHYB8|nr:hypothetical protein PHYBLDRAFT_62451 [Phycomyces blakesleeanus NRRL 1555(-)]OAD78791.1 hypothetical protein PHYBLDRAFT_62451 [Phycomyces blakesleeanus NRRL 1555(-)]|eukprot:XP_018296831.1 hypothetical protein PHYBLDRAFT_62451 [Phycomyces blakesleeanus NRRL 1555(-)]